MGTWGSALYSDDDAEDYRNDYTTQLRVTGSHEEAYKAVYDAFKKDLDGADMPDMEAIFWFVMADRQWYYGTLLPEVKAKALEYLHRDEHLKVWKEDEAKKLLPKRIAVLKALEERLNTPPPVVRKIPKLTICQQEIGDVFSIKVDKMDYFKTPELWRQVGGNLMDYYEEFNGKYLLFQIVGKDEDRISHDVYPLIRYFYWCGDQIPTIEEIRKLSIMPIVDNSASKEYLNEYLKYGKEIDAPCVSMLCSGSNSLKKHRIGFLPCATRNRHMGNFLTYPWFLCVSFYQSYRRLKSMNYIPQVWQE
jgi:hypothetical protein